MKMNRILILVALGLLLSAQIWAQDGLALMKVGHGARQAGMGEAVVSIPGSVDGTAYNPAAAAGVEQFTASFGHMIYWDDINLESGFFAKDIRPNWYWHGGIKYAGLDGLEQRLIPSLEPENTFEAYDMSIKSGLAYRHGKISVGFAVGWMIEKIEAWRGSAFNADFGAQYQVNDKINLGASAMNIGSDFNLTKPGSVSSRDISLPATYSFGGSYKYDKYLGAADIVYVDDDAHLHLGAEGRVHEMFLIRAGYMLNYDSKNFSAGISFEKRNITVDYAFVPYSNDLGTSHLFNLTFSL